MAIVVLVVLFILPASALAANLRQQTWQELENARENENIFRAQLSELSEAREKAQSEVSSLDENIAGLDQKVLAMKAQERQFEKSSRKLNSQTKELARQLYMLLNKDAVLRAIFAADSFETLMADLARQNIVLEKKYDKIADLKKERDAVLDQKEEISADIDDLLAQKQNLQNKRSQISLKIKETENNLQANQELQAQLEEQFSSLENLTSENSREFIAWNTAAGDNVTFYGAGTEHGLGMSQYGAKGYAEHGFDYKLILGHYYSGTKLEKIDTRDLLVRVKITKENPSAGDYNGSLENVNGEWINTLSLEDYLRGVVPVEVNHTWPKEALKAQAVAARSYAITHLSNGNWDMEDNTQYQVYLGKNYEADETDRAVEETDGQVLTFAGEIISAYFHSTSGGWTENNENVWGGKALPWLRGVASPFEEDSPYWNWSTKTYSRQELSNILNADERTYVGELKEIRIAARGVSGRVLAIHLVGSAGEKEVTGATFKSVFNKNTPDAEYLRSTLFGLK